MNRFIGVVALMVLLAVGAVVFFRNSESTNPDNRLSVVVTAYPLEEFAQKVGGNLVSVTNLVPAGVEPHDYQPTPQDVITAQSADLFIHIGSEFDAWATSLLADADVKQVEMSSLFESFDETAGKDPHIWLDLEKAKQMVLLIRDALNEIDADKSLVYNDNAQNYLVKIETTNQSLQAGLQNCELKDAVVSHNAFRYMARAYGFNTIAISGLSPDEQPSSQALAELIDQTKAKNLEYIFIEPLTNQDIAQTLANETGTKTLVLNPLEGLTAQELQFGKNFLSVMRENLRSLQTGLSCAE